jgi:hypothetical protein
MIFKSHKSLLIGKKIIKTLITAIVIALTATVAKADTIVCSLKDFSAATAGKENMFASTGDVNLSEKPMVLTIPEDAETEGPNNEFLKWQELVEYLTVFNLYNEEKLEHHMTLVWSTTGGTLVTVNAVKTCIKL